LLTLLHFQIIIDAVFFIVILILLWQLKRSVAKNHPLANDSAIQDLKKIMAESREFADEFMAAIEENKSALYKLARQLDDKAKHLMALLDEAERSTKRIESCRESSLPASTKGKYDDVLKMIQQGMSLEEVARKSGFTEGEINLVMELSRARTDE
jgi:hypothetical protein